MYPVTFGIVLSFVIVAYRHRKAAIFTPEVLESQRLRQEEGKRAAEKFRSQVQEAIKKEKEKL